MKNWSIRFKITLWFSTAMILIVFVTYFAILMISDRVIQKTVRDSLVEAVTHNVDEVEYYATLEDINQTNDVDHFIEFGDGYLEVDDDFLDELNEVYTGLYRLGGEMLYGENPIAKEIMWMEFVDEKVHVRKIGRITYYIYDKALTGEGLEDLWLRGVVSELQGEAQIMDISKWALLVLPSLVLLAVMGGYAIAGRTLRPIQEISRAAARIEKGGDLKKRIALGKGKDELHELAKQFNDMFARLEEAFATERQFTSDASHELRTPATVILAQCEYALSDAQTVEEYEDALRVVRRQVKKMTKLINDMLDVARLESRAESYTKEALDVSELVSSLCEDMALLKENKITLEWDVPSGVEYTGNRDLLMRLFTNLIGNAYRYGKEGGHIWVKLTKEGEGVIVSVEDDGIGIKEEDKEKIFRRFYQADASRTGAGSGLGLAMAQEIAAFHGGFIMVESEEGMGSRFIVKMV